MRISDVSSDVCSSDLEQLSLWGARVGVPVVARESGADPAAVAYEALERARAEGADVLLIDTAGRLHNKADLMAEPRKIVRVLKKLDQDRKSVGEGKSWSGRVDIGGGRNIKKKN